MSEWRRNALLTVVAVVAMVVLLASGAGHYLNEKLVYVPSQKARAALGLRPSLGEELRLVLADDRSLRELGRHPTLADWLAIAHHLEQLGFDTVLLHGFPALAAEVGTIVTAPERALFAAGVIAVNEAGKLGAYPADTLPRSTLVAGGAAADLPRYQTVLGPDPASFARYGRLGALNISTDNVFTLAFADAAGALLPNLALYASPALRGDDGAAAAFVAGLPRSADWTAYIDYVDPPSILRRSVPISAFFEPADRTRARTALSGALRERLAGGRVAVLVPAAYTGARTILSPLDGFVPSFVAFVSQVESVLRGRLIHRAVPSAALALPFVACLLFLLTRRSARLALGASAALVLLYVAGGFALFMTRHALLPTAEVVVTFGLLWLGRAGHQFLANRVAQAKAEQDLALGTLVQSLFLPKPLTGRIGAFAYRLIHEPYGAMSGDWLQTFQRDDGCGVLAMGDVVGKGPSAAMITSVVAGLWGSASQTWRDARIDMAAFAASVGATVHRTFRGEQNTTLAFAEIRADGLCLGVNASPKWIVWRAGQRAEVLRTRPGDPLGLREEPVVRSIEVAAAPGDVFIAFSDGVIDGTIALRAFLEALSPEAHTGDTAVLFETVWQAARQVGASTALPDDKSMILLRRDA